MHSLAFRKVEVYPGPSRRTFSRKLILISVTVLSGFLVNAPMLGNGEHQDVKQETKPTAAEKSDAEDDVYSPGGEVKPPRLVHYVEPNFSSSSKEAFVEGVVKISAVVMTDGTADKLNVTSGLNAEEDRRALEAVKQWRFAPGTRRGQAVKVRVNVEVIFHLL